MPNSDTELDAALKEQFQALPSVVQQAILSADTETKLRTISTTHKLHLDKGGILENEVMLALLGVKDMSSLPLTLQTELGLTEAEAISLSADISHAIFEPIREEMQRALGAPQAHQETHTELEQVTTALLAEHTKVNSTDHRVPPLSPVPAVAPATPPPPPPGIQSIRTPVSGEKPTESSAVRKSVANDLYREQV
jgi:hypothetical protein